jgi:hypothetical protein
MIVVDCFEPHRRRIIGQCLLRDQQRHRRIDATTATPKDYSPFLCLPSSLFPMQITGEWKLYSSTHFDTPIDPFNSRSPTLRQAASSTREKEIQLNKSSEDKKKKKRKRETNAVVVII